MVGLFLLSENQTFFSFKNAFIFQHHLIILNWMNTFVYIFIVLNIFVLQFNLSPADENFQFQPHICLTHKYIFSLDSDTLTNSSFTHTKYVH